MQEVWRSPSRREAVDRFYHPGLWDITGDRQFRDGHVQRLRWDWRDFANPRENPPARRRGGTTFAIRFIFSCVLTQTGENFATEVIYFYRLREWQGRGVLPLSDANFDYKQSPSDPAS